MDISLFKTLGGLTVSFLGGSTVWLAQFSPKEAEGWLQLGGVGIALAGAGYAIKYLIKKNEDKDAAIAGLIASAKKERDDLDAKRDAERDRLERKWDGERAENLDHREKDRASRDKLADAVDKLADVVKPKD